MIKPLVETNRSLKAELSLDELNVIVESKIEIDGSSQNQTSQIFESAIYHFLQTGNGDLLDIAERIVFNSLTVQPEYVNFHSEDTLFIGIPTLAEFEFKGAQVKIETKYPHDGKIKVTINSPIPTEFKLAFRIPDWAVEVTTEFPTQTQEAEYENGFTVFDETWNGTQVIEIDMPMEPEIMESHPRQLDNIGRIAVMYGPSVYCLQSDTIDQAPHAFSLDLAEEITVSQKNRMPILNVHGLQTKINVEKPLYEREGNLEEAPVIRQMIPYRDAVKNKSSWTQVWIRKHN
jgi:uncharacterized protein